MTIETEFEYKLADGSIILIEATANCYKDPYGPECMEDLEVIFRDPFDQKAAEKEIAQIIEEAEGAIWSMYDSLKKEGPSHGLH